MSNMEQSKEQRRLIPNWSELCPDLLRSVFKRLSFTDLTRANSVCPSWHSASRGCLPEPKQPLREEAFTIPWLILFPRKAEANNNNNINNSIRRCVLFVSEDKEIKVYKTRDLGVDFVQSRRRCWLATYGSWLLLRNCVSNYHHYILNPLTGERIDLPDTKDIIHNPLYSIKACFGIDNNNTKDYLVVLTMPFCTVFTKKGFNKWHELPRFKWDNETAYDHKNQTLYLYHPGDPVKIWDLSGDQPREDGFLDCFGVTSRYGGNLSDSMRRLAVTVSGEVLIVLCCRRRGCKTWCFGIYKANYVRPEWVRIDSLGDEALILDMGMTVVAKDVPGIKRNSIYFSGHGYGQKDPDDILVFDLTTQKTEHLPQCVSSSIQFSDARWFFPGFNG